MLHGIYTRLELKQNYGSLLDDVKRFVAFQRSRHEAESNDHGRSFMSRGWIDLYFSFHQIHPRLDIFQPFPLLFSSVPVSKPLPLSSTVMLISSSTHQLHFDLRSVGIFNHCWSHSWIMVEAKSHALHVNAPDLVTWNRYNDLFRFGWHALSFPATGNDPCWMRVCGIRLKANAANLGVHIVRDFIWSIGNGNFIFNLKSFYRVG